MQLSRRVKVMSRSAGGVTDVSDVSDVTDVTDVRDVRDVAGVLGVLDVAVGGVGGVKGSGSSRRLQAVISGIRARAMEGAAPRQTGYCGAAVARECREGGVADGTAHGCECQYVVGEGVERECDCHFTGVLRLMVCCDERELRLWMARDS